MKSEDVEKSEITSSFREKIIYLPNLTEYIGISVHVEVHVEMLCGGGTPGCQTFQPLKQVNKL